MFKSIKLWFQAHREVSRLREENDRLRQRIEQNQELINRTNAYWKGVMRKRSGNKQPA